VLVGTYHWPAVLIFLLTIHMVNIKILIGSHTAT